MDTSAQRQAWKTMADEEISQLPNSSSLLSLSHLSIWKNVYMYAVGGSPPQMCGNEQVDSVCDARVSQKFWILQNFIRSISKKNS